MSGEVDGEPAAIVMNKIQLHTFGFQMGTEVLLIEFYVEWSRASLVHYQALVQLGIIKMSHVPLVEVLWFEYGETFCS